MTIRRLSAFVILFSALAAWSISSFAANSYVIVNDDKTNANTVSIYKLDTANGTLTFAGRVATTGQGLGGGAIAPGQAVTSDAHCLFAIDTGSNDIAAFASPSYKLVGKFSNSALSFHSAGGSIALTPNGKFLYAAYTASANIGAWQVHPNCSLTYIGAYVPSVGADEFSAFLGVSPNGSVLVVPAPDFSAAESFKIKSDGSLIDLGFASFANVPTCVSIGCYPASVDFTKDSKIVVFGNITSYGASVLTASIDTMGTLSNPQEWDLQGGLILTNAVSLSAAAYAGNGWLYVGLDGGVVTANFTESPLSITTVNSTVNYSLQGGIAITGNTMVSIEPLNDLAAFRINSDGSLTPLSTVTDTGANLLWPTIFPNTR